MSQENSQAVVYKQQINKAFTNAWNGITYFFKNERNGIIQAGVAMLVLLLGFYFHLSPSEWIIIIVCIGAVIAMEMMNAAIEQLCNLVYKEYHPAIKIIKDVAAGAVLFVAIISSVIGLIIFIPKILQLL
ncbi:MAG: diacylglycerol kinase family protein [Bacteroidetes bacterium]|nr:diacylglycerol kinase family protein [Bacteroidota bacterium]